MLLSAAEAGRFEPGADLPEYEYRRETGHAFADAVVAVEDAIASRGFRVRVVHDIQATLAAKGFRVKPIRIYEIVGGEDIAASLCGTAPDCRVDRLWPCRVNVFVEEGRTVITALRPTLLCRVFPEEALEAVAVDLERMLVDVVDSAAS